MTEEEFRYKDTQLETLRHYVELARRKKAPNTPFAAGTDSDLFKTFCSLAVAGFVKAHNAPDDPAHVHYFSVTDEGRAAAALGATKDS